MEIRVEMPHLKTKQDSHDQQDTAWKDVLDTCIQDFFEYCLPEISQYIDWSKGWESLDAELHGIMPHNISGKRILDKLIKVFLKTGEEQWILLHVEVQGRKDGIFPERMFIYNYRLFDKFRRPIISCAILTDGNKNWRPDSFSMNSFGTKHHFEYLVVKLLDYRHRKLELENSANPFSCVILSQLAALAAKGRSQQIKFNAKYDVTRRLYEKKFDVERARKVLLFIDWLFGLSEPLALEYRNKVFELEESQKMAYISSFERFAKEEGMQQGMQQGMQKGESAIILMQLKCKFGKLDGYYQDRINTADAHTLLEWARRILDAQKIEEVFQE